jgi:hypothetical protein
VEGVPGDYAYDLIDFSGAIWLTGTLTLTAADDATARSEAYKMLLTEMVLPERYQISPVAEHLAVNRTRNQEAGFESLVDPATHLRRTKDMMLVPVARRTYLAGVDERFHILLAD